MRRFAVTLGGMGAALAAFLLLVGPVSWGSRTDDNPGAEPTMSVSPSGLPSESGEPPAPSDEPSVTPTCSADDRLAAALAVMGFDRSDVRIGDQIRWNSVPPGRVATSYNFGGAVASLEALQARFRAGGQVSDAYGAAFVLYLASGDANRLLSGEGVIPIQVKQSVALGGNMQRVDNAPQLFPTEAEAEEVIWVLLPRSCHQPNRVIGIRKVCGNPVIWGKL